MGFTIKRECASQIPDEELKNLIVGLYQQPLETNETSTPGDGVQFGYEEFPDQDKLDNLLGQVADENNPIGVYLDIRPFKFGDYYIFSINKLADKLSKENIHKSFLGKLLRKKTVYDELAFVIKEIAEHPIKGYPIVSICW